MRIIAIATLCALAALPAQAQQVDRIKASGANAAGACAGSLDMVGQYLSRAQTPDPEKIANTQQARNFFAELPVYPVEEITAAANAFITFMLGRLDKAQTVAEREAIQREIIAVASGCMATAQDTIASSRSTLAPGATPVPGGTAQPYVAPPSTAPATQPYVLQPSTTVPYVEQPSAVQPYTTQPLTLDPVLPSQ